MWVIILTIGPRCLQSSVRTAPFDSWEIARGHNHWIIDQLIAQCEQGNILLSKLMEIMFIKGSMCLYLYSLKIHLPVPKSGISCWRVLHYVSNFCLLFHLDFFFLLSFHKPAHVLLYQIFINPNTMVNKRHSLENLFSIPWWVNTWFEQVACLCCKGIHKPCTDKWIVLWHEKLLKVKLLYMLSMLNFESIKIRKQAQR